MKPEFSKKTIRKRNGERNRFLKLGGEIIDIQSLSSEMISDAYIKLFNARWSGKIRPFPRKNLLDAIEKFRPMIFGSALSINKEIIAIDLILKSECPEWIYFDDINGGYDPQYNEIGAGSILLWENYTRAKEICQSENKKSYSPLGSYLRAWSIKDNGATFCH
jgi:hypothetical protein